ncbi:MAG: hypothetical protein ACLRT5_01120 [Lachnospiraceae bacterium]
MRKRQRHPPDAGYQVTDAGSGVLRCVGQSSHCFLDREVEVLWSLKKERPLWDEQLSKAGSVK